MSATDSSGAPKALPPVPAQHAESSTFPSGPSGDGESGPNSLGPGKTLGSSISERGLSL